MKYALVLGMSALVAMPLAANATAIIDNGTIQLGINDLGHLNTYDGSVPSAGGTLPTGLRDLRTGFEATAPGCLCEGWGAAVADTGVFGYANEAAGIVNVTLGAPMVFDASTATTVANVGTSLEVTHQFAPSESDDLYRVTVSIKNTSGADIADLRYTRVMDWDVEPTPFSEYVTIGGTALATAVLSANTNGFGTGNPLTPDADMGDFVDAGPNDHGAQFNFGFGALLMGETKTFDIYYGASPTERDAFNALNAVGAEVYSFGQANDDINGTGPGRSTFIFAFSGVGGVVVPPAVIPVPASALLLLGGLGMLGSLRTRRKAA
jgi:archaellin